MLCSAVMSMETNQGNPQSLPLSPPTPLVNQNQVLLTSLMVTALVASKPEGLGEHQEGTNREKKKKNRSETQNKGTYRPSSKNKSQKQNHSRYSGR